MSAKTNLPSFTKNDSAAGTKLFFDSYGKVPFEFSAVEVDATIGFFEKLGWGAEAAKISASALLKQAKLDEVPIFTLLDQIKTFDAGRLSALVAEILNNNRQNTSTLGFRDSNVSKLDQRRNIGA